MPRDDFPAHVVREVGERVSHLCSNPDCGWVTISAKLGESGRANIGKAGHIRAAAPGGPRYDPSQSPEERKSLSNAIWLCSNDAALIDSDPERYPVELLEQWKSRAEDRSRRNIAGGAIRTSGVSSELTQVTVVPVERTMNDELAFEVQGTIPARNVTFEFSMYAGRSGAITLSSLAPGLIALAEQEFEDSTDLDTPGSREWYARASWESQTDGGTRISSAIHRCTKSASRFRPITH